MRALGITRISSFYLALVAVGAGILWARGALGTVLPHTARAWAVGLGLGLAVGLALVAVTRVLAARTTWAARLATGLRSIVGELGRREALAVAVASGVGEEILFRGALQPVLGIWVVALLFGMLHLGPTRHFWPWTLMACAAGLIFGWMYLVTGDLCAPVVAHATVNFLNLRFLALTDRRPYVTLGPTGNEEAAE